MTIATDIARERARQTTGQFGVQERSAPQMTLDARAKVERARELTEDLLTEHGLHDWRVRFDNAQRRLGQCRPDTKTISLSRQYAAVSTEEQTLDTIRHEVAHALAGHDAGHGPAWQEIARRLGATPKATTSDHGLTDAKTRRRDDAARAVPYRRFAQIPDGTEVLVAAGQNYLRGMRATIVSKAQTRYLVETEDGQRFKARSEMLAPVPTAKESA